MARGAREARGGAKRGPALGVLIKFTAFAIATSLLTYVIGAQIVGADYGDKYELKASFEDVGGLIKGDLVKVAGAPVGKVSAVEVAAGRAVVTMEVEKDLRLPADSTAEIRWRNLIGQRLVYLVPGAQTGRYLEDGATLAATKAVVDLGEIVNSLGPLTGSLDPDQLNKILQATAAMLDGNGDDIGLMTVGLQNLVGSLATRKDDLTSILDSYSTLTETAVRRDEQIAGVIDDLVAISEAFAGNTDVLGSAGTELAQVSEVLDQVISGNQRELDRTVANLDTVVKTAVGNIDELDQIVTGLPPALRSLFAVTNGGHYVRINAMCLNIVQGECPTQMKLSGPGNTTSRQQMLDGQETLADLVARLTGSAPEGGNG
ncbi:phospholipid/cholesterol/gamma-HCH transport system substrate-binding protein [Actinocorallia herbida]|uniref:Phospholipid/cholesterol/gamma-HCH transport system substrate-binding protein n=1 Tax=Actinocorallia herbida TaxID=58109 RepID=A0A3N1D8C9_9ACTN|nr:MlaD family protein [Actinocorallia herbida]ROO89751.1 phospholipid/cholesterol/gamma-HCH transport system substrate-binding protein [Actinocorallia herbida]